MALAVYFAEDIEHAIVGLVTAVVETAQANGYANTDHVAGIATLAKGLALSFGIDWAVILAEIRAALRADLGDRQALTITKILESGGSECLPGPE